MKINFNQLSTQYGFIILLISVFGVIGWWNGKDIAPLIPFVMAIGKALHSIFVDDK